jgi:heterotetrameric sarcosine oxidase gamma subunit
VVSLISRPVFDDLLPFAVEGMTLADATPARILSVAPFEGALPKVATALGKLGLGWPDPNRATRNGDAACLWSGRGQAFLVNADPKGLEGSAALTDQTDGWAVMSLAGEGAAQVLARLVSIDLRPATFGVGQVARTPVNHMMALLERTGDQAFRIFVFRSMAATAVHEIAVAMQAVAARSHA